MYLFTSPLPQFEFASLCLFQDKNNADKSKCLESFIEVMSVTSPVSTIPASIANRALHDLFESMNNGTNSHGDDNNGNENDRSDSDEKNDDDQMEINDNNDNTIDHIMNNLQSSLLNEEQQYYKKQQQQIISLIPNSTGDSMNQVHISSKNVHGLTIYYCTIMDTNTISNCLAIINPTSISKTSTIEKNNNNHNWSLAVCIGCTGISSQLLYHTLSQYQPLLSKINQLSTILSPSSASTKFNISSIKDAVLYRNELELLLSSILLDDEIVTTNEQIQALEQGNFNSFQQNQHQQQQQQSSTKSLSSLLSSSKKKDKRKSFFPKKFNFTNNAANRWKNKFSSKSNNDTTSDNDDLYSTNKADFGTAFLSSNVTPPSDITRIISDQMQALSFVEKSMNLKLYSSSESSNNNNVLSSNRRRNGKPLGSDLAGFDYNIHQKYSEQKNNTDRTTLSVSTDATSVTSSSSSYNVSLTPSSSSSSASVVSSSSSSFIPALSGPIRDSSSYAKTKDWRHKVRKNKIGDHARNKSSSEMYSSANFDPFGDDYEEEEANDDEEQSEVMSRSAMSTTSSSYSVTSEVSTNPLHHRTNQMQNVASPKLKVATPSASPKTNYVPGSRKLFVNVALNEDLSCLYNNSQLQTLNIDGTIQILLKSDSTAFVPFTFVLTDVENQIESLVENAKVISTISREEFLKGNDANDIIVKNRFLVSLPRYDHFFEALKYKCKPTLLPVPIVSTKYQISSTLYFCIFY